MKQIYRNIINFFVFPLRIFFLLLFFGMLQAGAVNFLPGAFAAERIVAVVNNEAITQKDVDDFVNFMRVQLSQQITDKREFEKNLKNIESDVVNRLIEDRLIIQEAKKQGINIDENRVKSRIDALKSRYPSEKYFIDSLLEQGLSLADLENRLREQLMMYTLVEYKIKSRIVVNPSEVTEFYQQNIDKFKIGDQKEFLVVSTSEMDIAKDFSDEVRKEGDFQKAADKYRLSVNKITVSKTGQLDKNIESAMMKLGVGEVSPVVSFKDLYYVFKLNQIIPASQQNLCDVQDEIYNLLYNQKMQDKMVAWLDELKKKSYIKVF